MTPEQALERARSFHFKIAPTLSEDELKRLADAILEAFELGKRFQPYRPTPEQIFEVTEPGGPKAWLAT